VQRHDPPEDFVAVATQLQRWDQQLSRGQRDEFLKSIPVLSTQEIVLDECEGYKERRGSLKSGEGVVLTPLPHRWEVPRLISIYAMLSRSVNVQRLFGVFHDPSGDYAVMEDLEGSPFVLLSKALSDNQIAGSTRTQRLRLCYEIALTVAYLHSVNIVVKVISDTSIYLRNSDTGFIPVLTNLGQARAVLHNLIRWLTIRRQ
jgi:serine/threonine protein kinase